MPTVAKFCEAELIAQPLRFAGGKVAPNRLSKAPLEETLAKAGGGPPNHAHFELYRAWARGGWGMIITGNVAIDPTHLGSPFDVVIPNEPKALAEFKHAMKTYARAVTGRDQNLPESQRPLGVVQIVHAGRQSMRGSGRGLTAPSLAPSAVPMQSMGSLGPLGKLIDHAMWGPVSAMTLDQIEWLKNRFVTAAQIVAEAGFDGVEIHGSHGYQLAAFLSPRTNLRTDQYGGSAENRARLLMEIIDAVRQKVPHDFLVGVKLNSSDYVQGGLSEDDALQNVKWLAEHGGVDFVEISGGNYENPSFVMSGFDSEKELAKIGGKTSTPATTTATADGDAKVQGSGVDPTAKTSARTGKREAFFQNFARRCRSVLPADSRLKLVLTGGLRTRHGIAEAISKDGGAVDMACLGRPAALFPDLPRRLTDPNIPDSDPAANTPDYHVPAVSSLALVPIKLLGAGWGTLWHTFHMAQTALGSPNPHQSTLNLLKNYASASADQNAFTPKSSFPFQLLLSLLGGVILLLALVKQIVP
ncbi:FMN-linked oxidoreductase [Testicularia cyperi]|uniref:FMN-linked oxidoreductase n=1 Tax=Testicularia cyperi TaxID=1882483 RepID=A0A317XKW9_9BASI|nr:FMN-linked oxidoreductase [Testicularia cyperi]